MYPIKYSVGMTSMLCSTAYQKINFIFNGEEMAITDAFVRPEEDIFCSFLNIPECIPALVFRRVLGLCGILKLLQTSRRSKAMLAISPA